MGFGVKIRYIVVWFIYRRVFNIDSFWRSCTVDWGIWEGKEEVIVLRKINSRLLGLDKGYYEFRVLYWDGDGER